MAALCIGVQAHASLTAFQSYVGNYGLSTDGAGSLSNGYNINAFVPLGSTVTAAYLYQSSVSGGSVQTVSFNGNALSFSPASVNGANGIVSARADVTSIVASIVNGGAGGTYGFDVLEGGSAITDGTALVVVYSNGLLPVATVGILDGFTAPGGDSTSINFADPLDPTAPGFFADLRLGIGYSAGGQSSTVRINGTTITNNAGDNDDGFPANGALITVGGDDDGFSPLLPTYAEDHERYDLTPYLSVGDTSIGINTNNPSADDNIFLAAFRVSGVAGVDEPPPGGVPEPSTWMMLIGGFGLVGIAARRRSRRLAV